MVEQVSSLKTDVKYKDTPIGKIPVDWEVVRLGDVCDIIGGSTPSTKRKEYWGGHIPFATPTDITSLRGREISITKESITSEGLSSCGARLLPVGSILLTSRATLGACAINTKSMATNQGFASLVCSEKAYNWFIFYKMISLKRELQTLGSGSTFKEVSKGNIRSLFLAIPSPPEQKKIAEILTTVDDAIEKTTQIIDKTKELKKGLMQRLLTRGIGHKKFKKTEIGEIPVEWDVGDISDYGDIITGNTPRTSVPQYYGKEYPFASPFDLGEKKTIIETEKYLSKRGLSAARALPPNSVLVVCIGSTIGKTGVAGLTLATNQQINSVICKNSDFNFVYYYLTFISKKIKLLSSTQAVPIINKGEFSKIRTAIPPIDEQKKIGDILSSIDNQMGKESNHKDQLNLLKKGLMQVLLTGKLRVIV